MESKFTETVTERRAYSIPELSRMYGLCIGFLRLEVKRGKLPIHRFGRRVVILKEDWDSYAKLSNP